jgi:hypothetical protein
MIAILGQEYSTHFLAELIRDASPYCIGHLIRIPPKIANRGASRLRLKWEAKMGHQVDPLKRGGDKHVTTNNFTMNALLGQDGLTHFLPS